ncbi:MAG TPA: 5-formyltetrahydrofolate cyclo-ligase [Candidatus Acutalibacter pullicola]|uniref:5-formyltetrahydrofolate cyclo-ligase n=1 Tax=Candidatus Acutalibacter pullicola TaxID=2838417 RepID=A0A9D2MT01_9FIRM|nr:5-formyltetrahydrofolate cyclo-ligase [Candidatus Acutalibacter pullicola]
MQEKAALRRELLAQRDAVPQREEKSRAVGDGVLALPAYQKARQVLLYLSKGSEVDTWEVFARAVAEGKEVYAPRCLDGEGTMGFFQVTSPQELLQGRFGLWEPDPRRCAPWRRREGALCLVPGIAFDRQGYRLGYGKGYYDRFLAVFSGTAAGLCFRELALERLPRGPQDRRVDVLVTEAGVLPIGKEGRI